MSGSWRSQNSTPVLWLVLAVSALGSHGLYALPDRSAQIDETGIARLSMKAPEVAQRSSAIDGQRVAIASSPARRHGGH